MARHPLKGCVIAASGDFGAERGHARLKNWVESNGGTWCATVGSETTHLICSKEHWKRKPDGVRRASRYKALYTVTYDWLEDTLMKRSRRKEHSYLLRNVERVALKTKAEQRAQERRQRKRDSTSTVHAVKTAGDTATASWDVKALADRRAGRKKTAADVVEVVEVIELSDGENSGSDNDDDDDDGDSDDEVECIAVQECPIVVEGEDDDSEDVPLVEADWALGDLENHHIYRDETGFDYDVTMARIDVTRNSNERYQLRLYESHTTPHTYAVSLKLSRPQTIAVSKTVCPIGSDYSTAFAAFRRHFQSKTQLAWDRRFDPPPVLETKLPPGAAPISEAAVRTGFFGVDVTVRPFVYRPPAPGRPRGVLPLQAVEEELPAMATGHAAAKANLIE